MQGLAAHQMVKAFLISNSRLKRDAREKICSMSFSESCSELRKDSPTMDIGRDSILKPEFTESIDAVKQTGPTNPWPGAHCACRLEPIERHPDAHDPRLEKIHASRGPKCASHPDRRAYR